MDRGIYRFAGIEDNLHFAQAMSISKGKGFDVNTDTTQSDELRRGAQA